MPDNFDPYRDWLGLPAGRPEHHYALFSLTTFESDRHVIEAAAKQASSRLWAVQPGPHAADWQRLFAELSMAQSCLLDEAARGRYDVELRGRSNAGGTPAPQDERGEPAASVQLQAAVGQGERPVAKNVASSEAAGRKSLPSKSDMLPPGSVSPGSVTSDGAGQRSRGESQRSTIAPKPNTAPAVTAPVGQSGGVQANRSPEQSDSFDYSAFLPPSKPTATVQSPAVTLGLDDVLPPQFGPADGSPAAIVQPPSSDVAFVPPSGLMPASIAVPQPTVSPAAVPPGLPPAAPYESAPYEPTPQYSAPQFATPSVPPAPPIAAASSSAPRIAVPPPPPAFGLPAIPTARTPTFPQPSGQVENLSHAAAPARRSTAQIPNLYLQTTPLHSRKEKSSRALVFVAAAACIALVSAGIGWAVLHRPGPPIELATNDPTDGPNPAHVAPSVPMQPATNPSSAPPTLPATDPAVTPTAPPATAVTPATPAAPVVGPASPPATDPSVPTTTPAPPTDPPSTPPGDTPKPPDLASVVPPAAVPPSAVPPATVPPATVPGDKPAVKPGEMPAETPAEPGPAAMPVKKPKVAPPAGDQQQAAKLRQTLAEARKELGQRNLVVAKQLLDAAASMAKTAEQQTMVSRMQMLANYVSGFWEAVGKAFGGLKTADVIKVGSTEVAVIEASPTALSIRNAGRVQRFTLGDVPAGLAFSLALNWYDAKKPGNKAYLGAFQAVDPTGDPAEAKRLWEEAALGGVDTQFLMPLLSGDGGVGATAGDRGALPEPDGLVAAEKAFQDEYGEQIAAAKMTTKKVELAKKLFEAAKQVRDDAGKRYVLLREARDLGASAGATDVLIGAVDELNSWYAIDPLKMKAEVMSKHPPLSTAASKAAATTALKLMSEAMAAKRYDVATTLGTAATAAAKRSASAELIKLAREKNDEVQILKKSSE